MDDADDWEENIYFSTSSKTLGSLEAGGVPFSCCIIDPKSNDTLMNTRYCGHGVRLPDYVRLVITNSDLICSFYLERPVQLLSRRLFRSYDSVAEHACSIRWLRHNWRHCS